MRYNPNDGTWPDMDKLNNERIAKLERQNAELLKALEEIRDLFDGEADASCEPGDDRYRPNRAMQVDMIVDAALAKMEAK